MNNETIDPLRFLVCPYCNKTVNNAKYSFHLRKEHGMEGDRLIRECLYEKILARIRHIPKDIKKKYIDRLWVYNKCEKIYVTQFGGTYDHTLAAFGKFDENDIEYFFSTVLPFKLSHPSQPNDRKLAAVEAHDDPEKTELIYQKFMLSKNPFVGHGAELSPFSKNFIGYKDMTDEEKEKRAWDAAQRDRDDKLPTQLKYWIAKGYDEDEAREMLAERQRTFTIEKCIERYGESEGKRIYEERQIKWQNTLNSKPPEEIERINRAKMCSNLIKRGWSVISQDLFWDIYDAIKDDFKTIVFATKDRDTGNKTCRNNEWFVISDTGSHYFLDFFIKDTMTVIEFDGDYWHKLAERKESDMKKDQFLLKSGYRIFHVKECDYNADPKGITQKCLEFIYAGKTKETI